MEFWQAVSFLETDQLLDVARRAEEVGFTGIITGDHLVHPHEIRSPYPYTADGAPIWAPEAPWPDTWCLVSAMAAVTTRLRFASTVYIAPARDLLTVAKSVGTAAVLSGGRVALGVGVGWMREEFDLTGQDFDDRGRRLDDMIPALRTLWGEGWAEYHGTHFDFGPLQMNPTPPAPVPIWYRGDSGPAVRRAATLCDGYINGEVGPLADAARWVARVRQARRDAVGDDDGFTVLCAVSDPLDPDLCRRLEDLGVTGIMCAPWMTAEVVEGRYGSPLAAKLAAIESFAETVIAKV